MDHEHLEQLCEAYALGVLDAEEHASLSQHLQQGCPSCSLKIAGLGHVVAQLAESVEPVIPREQLKQRILAKTNPASFDPLYTPSEVLKNKLITLWMKLILGFSRFKQACLKVGTKKPITPSSESFFFLRSDQGQWNKIYPGIMIRMLYTDLQHGFSTMLLKMDARSHFPTHIHKNVEQIYIIEGECIIGDLNLNAGSYLRAEKNTTHPNISTESGCLLLILSPKIKII